MTRKQNCLFAALLLAALVLAGCQAGFNAAPKAAHPEGITQVATIDALLAGVYDGHMSLATLLQYGNFGIGTFEGLDGEMILLDGAFYKVRDDGKVYLPDLTEETPFASVTRLVPDITAPINRPLDMQAFMELVDELAPRQNSFCAFLVRGDFVRMRTRSVPKQQKPYPPLAEVTKNQPVFDFENISGMLVGFRSPDFVKGVNVPGYHIHFLADDLSGGGHVLGFELARGVLEADTVHNWLNLFLPDQSQAFDNSDLAIDRTEELKTVEQER
ncbi:MAG: acetolactate decarboxylase [Desulfatibacillaceae bacterium]|nr:acetolactate decarboxylase [Desulfatibacillaceae bacterium]